MVGDPETAFIALTVLSQIVTIIAVRKDVRQKPTVLALLASLGMRTVGEWGLFLSLGSGKSVVFAVGCEGPDPCTNLTTRLVNSGK